MQATHWPEAKRAFQPIDVEYLSCECRKYYSYVNGTKKYEGKNVFRPGKSPMLTFDAEPSRKATAAGHGAASKVRLKNEGHHWEAMTSKLLLVSSSDSLKLLKEQNGYRMMSISNS